MTISKIANPERNRLTAWTPEEDSKVLGALAMYNENKSLTPFLNNPFGNKGSYSKIKKLYLQDLPKNRKQIRDRCITALFSEVAFPIKEEHEPIILDLCKQHNNSWNTVSRLSYDTILNQEKYYPGNAIKNLFHKYNEKHNSSLRKTKKSNTELTSDNLKGNTHIAKKIKSSRTSSPTTSASSSSPSQGEIDISQEDLMLFLSSCFEDDDS